MTDPTGIPRPYGVGRSPTGGLRNFAAMGERKLKDVFEGLVEECEAVLPVLRDTEALNAAKRALERKGWLPDTETMGRYNALFAYEGVRLPEDIERILDKLAG